MKREEVTSARPGAVSFVDAVVGFLARHATKLGAVTKELLHAEHNSNHYSLTTD